jgi:hypothetical protein
MAQKDGPLRFALYMNEHLRKKVSVTNGPSVPNIGNNKKMDHHIFDEVSIRFKWPLLQKIDNTEKNKARSQKKCQ